jgi:MSHA biogenesis protein MshJ
MDALRAQLRKLIERIDELSLRERAFIFLGVLAVMYFATMQLVIQPLTAQRVRLDNELKAKRMQIQATENQIQGMLGGDVIGADPTKRARLESLREQLKALDADMNRSTAGLVAPKEMGRLVERFLAGKQGLEVVKMESLKPEPLLTESAKSAVAAIVNPLAGVSASDALIYKHGMRIELRGSYLDMLAYLRGLEQLPWKVFWGQVELKSEEYPVSRMTLVIYTLSTREGWIAI